MMILSEAMDTRAVVRPISGRSSICNTFSHNDSSYLPLPPIYPGLPYILVAGVLLTPQIAGFTTYTPVTFAPSGIVQDAHRLVVIIVTEEQNCSCLVILVKYNYYCLY